MIKFDFIDSTMFGYSYVWRERKPLIRMAAVPIALKIILFAIILALGLENNLLRQGIFLLPAYFAEGLLVAVVIRAAILGQPAVLPWLRGSHEIPADAAVKRSLKAAVAVFVLLKVISSLAMGIVLGGQQAGSPPAEIGVGAEGGGSPLMFLLATGFLAFCIWGFRFFWLYVPVVLQISMREFAVRLGSFVTSLHMIGLWLMAFMPAALVVIVLSEIALGVFPGTDDGLSAPYTFTMAIIQAFFETYVTLVASIAMGHAIAGIWGIRRKGQGGAA